jgi:signal transduction histidine kinase
MNNSEDSAVQKPTESTGSLSHGDAKRQIRAYQRQLRRLASELCLTEARERREIASLLHDHIGQALAYVSQRLSTLRGEAIFSGFEGEFTEILTILSQTIRYTRNLTVEISPPVLYELGLSAALDWLAEQARQRHNIKVTLKQSGSISEISEETRVFLFKAVQELITNIVKHAGATEIVISSDWKEAEIEIEVTDNGRGFEVASMEKRLIAGDCFGLFSIRERLSSIGGALTIDSTPGKGTRVTLKSGYTIVPEALDD